MTIHSESLDILVDGETIAGFIHIGALTQAPLERPRPVMAHKVTRHP